MTELAITDPTEVPNADTVISSILDSTSNSEQPPQIEPDSQTEATTEPVDVTSGPGLLPTEGSLSELDAAEAKLRALIVPPNQIAPWLRVHIYGRPGAGKTIMGANSGLRTLVVNIEEGAVSLNNHPEIRAHCEVMEFKNFQQLHVLATLLQEGRLAEFR